MSRNVESRFALAPQVNVQRSKFNINNSVKTSFNVGQIVPFYVSEVLPGDTHKIKTSKVVRLQTLLTPVMDNIYLDTYYFFVPNRLVWKHWKEFMGENTSSAWLPATTYTIPQIEAPSGGWSAGTIADYFGIPIGVDNISVSALPFRAYAKILNDYFRDENLSDPLVIPDDETTVIGVNTGTFVTDVAKGGLPYTAAKYHDYFTSCLPAPQKGPDVTLSLTESTGAVYGNGFNLAVTNGSVLSGFSLNGSGDFEQYPPAYSARLGESSTHTATMPSATVGLPTKTQLGDHLEYSGLVADVGGQAIVTINQLREAFQIQKFYEKDARGGSRYIEILKSHFGVTSPDARLQRPEYLGGNRVPIVINQVVQSSGTQVIPDSDSNATTYGSPQGHVTGQSLTADSHYDFTRSFTEHGYVIGLMVARYDHTYQQGIERHWSRTGKMDYYWPVFANIGEQAVKNKEIYAQGSDQVNPSTSKAYDEEVFGYQEAWAEYRYKPSYVTGEMRSAYATSLDSWHLADDYNSLPSLSDSWIREDKTNVDRCLAVQSSSANQLFADLYIQNLATRPMPMFSIPGLMDHH